MTTQLIAVLPVRIRRRWDAIAAHQLAAELDAVSKQNDDLDRRAYWAEQTADMWERTAEIERERGIVGLTIDGRIVRIDGNPGATIDDDLEYRGIVQ